MEQDKDKEGNATTNVKSEFYNEEDDEEEEEDENKVNVKLLGIRVDRNI
jgi:hypothetical protein